MWPRESCIHGIFIVYRLKPVSKLHRDCNLLQIKNDRFGRRGTSARIIMRAATSADILIERPNTWPKPPPGFSTKRILGPGSDYQQIDDYDDEPEDNYQNNNNDSGPRKKRRRRNSDGPNNNRSNNNGGNNNNNNNNNGDQRKKNSATGKRRQRGGLSNSTPQPSAADRLNQGLSSSRAGFSVEELEAARAAKKNATSK